MPKWLSRSKHEELELNSSSQIRSHKERRAKSEKMEHCRNFAGLRNLEFCRVAKFRISQVAKFRISQVAKFRISQVAKFRISQDFPDVTVHVSCTIHHPDF